MVVRTEYGNGVVTLSNLFTSDDQLLINSYIQSVDWFEYGLDYTYRTDIGCQAIGNILHEIRNLAQKSIAELYNRDATGGDFGTLVKYLPGWTLGMHKDWPVPEDDLRNEQFSPRECDVSTILYFTGDLVGGDLYFPQHNITVTPQPGLLVHFASSDDHEVTLVRQGIRITTPGFWKFN